MRRLGRLGALAAVVAIGALAATLVVARDPSGSPETGQRASTGETRELGTGGRVPTSMLPSERMPTLGSSVAEAANNVNPGTRVGLAVHDRASGRMFTSINADRDFYTASLVKLLITLDVLREHDWQVPDSAMRDELARMLSLSHDGIASALWSTRDGAAMIDRMAGLLNLRDTAPPEPPSQWGQTSTSARDVITIYRFITEELPPTSREFVLSALRDTAESAADGFAQHFGIPRALPDATWAIKQGWMMTGEEVVLNTTGTVGEHDRFLVALLTSQPEGTSYAEAREAVTAGARAFSASVT